MMKKLSHSSLAAFGFAVLLLTGACATQGGGDPAMNPTVSADARDEADVDVSENMIAGGAPLNTTTETVVTTNTTASVDTSLDVDTNQSMASSSNLDTQSTTNTDDDDTMTATETRTRMRKD